MLTAGDITQVADDYVPKAEEEFGVELKEKKHVRIGEIDGVRYGFEGRGITAKMTFFPYAESTWRMVGLAPTAAADRYFGTILLTMRSFAPLTDAHRALIHTERLRVVLARFEEDQRT